jgi:membrane protein YdbS with pleckstrin-like domain
MSVVEDDGHGDATEVTGSPGRSRNLPDPVTSVAVALTFAGALTALMARTARREIDLASGEVVLFRARPRRAVFRYVLSLGLWELQRRSTEFAVTKRRVIVAHGLLVRHTRSIPLRQITGIEVVETPWERTVEVNGGAGGRASMRLGPLDRRAARGMTAAVAAAIATRRR